MPYKKKPADLHTMDNYCIGVISDTHGTLTRAAVTALEGVNMIIHAGDIDKQDVLANLRTIAPVIAVRGNMDAGKWALELQKTEMVKINTFTIFVLHDVQQLNNHPSKDRYNAVISGHTHRPSIERKNGVLFLNPGSAGYPRSNFPPSIALIHIRNNSLDAQIIDLE